MGNCSSAVRRSDSLSALRASRLHWLLLGITALWTAGAARAQVLRRPTAGNLIVSEKESVSEYTPGGELVQTVAVSLGADALISRVLDVSCDAQGTLYAVVESRRKYSLWIKPVGDGPPRILPLPHEQVSSLAYVSDLDWTADGRLAVLLNWSEALLLDPESGASEAIPAANCLCVGPQGKLYLGGGDVFNRYLLKIYSAPPPELEISLKMPREVATLAVQADGSFYTALYGTLYGFSPTGEPQGELVVSKQWSADAIYDLELLPDGRLAMGTRSGKVFVVDDSFDQETLTVFESKAGVYGCFIACVPGSPSEPAATRAAEASEPREAPPPSEPFSEATPARSATQDPPSAVASLSPQPSAASHPEPAVAASPDWLRAALAVVFVGMILLGATTTAVAGLLLLRR